MSQALYEKEKDLSAQDGVDQYLRQIRQIPLLTPEQEQDLAKACAAGDEEAIRQLVSANLRLVVHIARDYATCGIPLLDLIQEGSIGLLKAAKRFDYTLNLRFSTYATKWIRQQIYRYVVEQGALIHVPRYRAQQQRKLRAEAQQLAAQLGREPSERELAEYLGTTEDKLQQLQQQLPQICSLDAPVGEEMGSVQLLVEDLQTPQPQQELVRRELENTIRAMLDSLTMRQQQVLRLRFGMDDGVCQSFERIGSLLGISKERARQVEHEAIAKLQKLGTSLGLEDYLE